MNNIIQTQTQKLNKKIKFNFGLVKGRSLSNNLNANNENLKFNKKIDLLRVSENNNIKIKTQTIINNVKEYLFDNKAKYDKIQTLKNFFLQLLNKNLTKEDYENFKKFITMTELSFKTISSNHKSSLNSQQSLKNGLHQKQQQQLLHEYANQQKYNNNKCCPSNNINLFNQNGLLKNRNYNNSFYSKNNGNFNIKSNLKLKKQKLALKQTIIKQKQQNSLLLSIKKQDRKLKNKQNIIPTYSKSKNQLPKTSNLCLSYKRSPSIQQRKFECILQKEEQSVQFIEKINSSQKSKSFVISSQILIQQIENYKKQIENYKKQISSYKQLICSYKKQIQYLKNQIQTKNLQLERINREKIQVEERNCLLSEGLRKSQEKYQKAVLDKVEQNFDKQLINKVNQGKNDIFMFSIHQNVKCLANMMAKLTDHQLKQIHSQQNQSKHPQNACVNSQPTNQLMQKLSQTKKFLLQNNFLQQQSIKRIKQNVKFAYQSDQSSQIFIFQLHTVMSQVLNLIEEIQTYESYFDQKQRKKLHMFCSPEQTEKNLKKLQESFVGIQNTIIIKKTKYLEILKILSVIV